MRKNKLIIFALSTAALVGCNQSKEDQDVTAHKASNAHKIKKSLVVMVDGARYEALLNAYTPNFDTLSLTKAYTGGVTNSTSQSGTSTVEGESTIWTGSWHANQQSGFNGYPTVWQRLKESKPKINIGLYPNWDIFSHVKFDLSDIKNKEAFKTGTSRKADHENAKKIVDKIKSGTFDSLFTTIDQVDYYGHCYYGNSGGAWSDNYVQGIEEADKVLGYLLDAVKDREKSTNEDWLVLVLPDHGFNKLNDNGGADCSHGSQDIEAKKIWIASNEPDLMNEEFKSPLKKIANREKDGLYRYAAQTDIAPTLLSWHGVDIEPDWGIEGTPLIGDVGVRGLFASELKNANTVELSFTATNEGSIQVLRDGKEIALINDAIKGEVYKYKDELSGYSTGTHSLTYTLINNSVPKTVHITASIIKQVKYNSLPFSSITSLYTFDSDMISNSLSGGYSLHVTGQPKLALVKKGRFKSALYHQRVFNNDVSFEDNQTNTDKFTISFWFTGDGSSYDPALLTNKKWKSSLDGTVVAQLNDTIKAQIGETGKGSCCFVSLPYTATKDKNDPKWNLFVMSVDKTKPWSQGQGNGVMTVGVYNAEGNFSSGAVDLTGNRVNTMRSGKDWLINNDYAQNANSGYAVMFDEIAVWNDAALDISQMLALGKAKHSLVYKVAVLPEAMSASVGLDTVEYLGENPNLSKKDKQKEAFWKRARQMSELSAQ